MTEAHVECERKSYTWMLRNDGALRWCYVVVAHTRDIS